METNGRIYPLTTITNPREIEIKRRWIAECGTAEEIAVWREAIRENGGERFPGEAELVAQVEVRITGVKR